MLKISSHKQFYNPKFGVYYQKKIYEKPNYAETVNVPDETEIIAGTLKQLDADEKNVYSSIGKMLEDAGFFDKARLFYHKLFETSPDASDVDDDISRVVAKNGGIKKTIDLNG